MANKKKKSVKSKAVSKKATASKKKTATKKTTASKKITANKKAKSSQKKTQVAKKTKASKKAATRAGSKTTKSSLAQVKTNPKVAPKLETKKSQVIDYSKAITPLGDRIVVRVITNERITPGGLIIPDTATQAEGFYKGTVLAAGTGKYSKKGKFKPLDVAQGDTVLFSQYAGTKVVFNNEELQIIHESDVMGVVSE